MQEQATPVYWTLGQYVSGHGNYPKHLALRLEGRRRQVELQAEWRDQRLRVTGPERIRSNGLRRPDLAGGLPEFLELTAGLAMPGLDLFETMLTVYATATCGRLWARFSKRSVRPSTWTMHFPTAVRPDAPRTPVVRSRRGGTLLRGGRIILPLEVESMRDPDERSASGTGAYLLRGKSKDSGNLQSASCPKYPMSIPSGNYFRAIRNLRNTPTMRSTSSQVL